MAFNQDTYRVIVREVVLVEYTLSAKSPEDARHKFENIPNQILHDRRELQTLGWQIERIEKDGLYVAPV